MLSGCSEDIATEDIATTRGEIYLDGTTRREIYVGGDVYITTPKWGGEIMPLPIIPLPKEMKKLIAEHKTYLEVVAVLGPCHESFGSGIGRELWYFDDHTCLILSRYEEEAGWYRWKVRNVFFRGGREREKIANYKIRYD